MFSIPLWKRQAEYAAVKPVNWDFVLRTFRVQCYSTRKASGIRKPVSKKADQEPKEVMKEGKDAFFVVRKGDVVGVYKSLSDCQAQVGSSVINLFTLCIVLFLNYDRLLFSPV